MRAPHPVLGWIAIVGRTVQLLLAVLVVIVLLRPGGGS
jgi:hypothetical protein